MKKLIMAAVLVAATAAPASAYTIYMKPDEYWPADGNVRVETAFANQFFTPQIAFSSEFSMVLPDGTVREFGAVEISTQTTSLRAGLPIGGTYRITSGERLGQVTTMVGIDGGWRELPAGQVAPEGAPVTTLQTVTLADVYVTRGQATRDVVDRPIGRLALRPVTHPNQVLAANPFQVQVLFDGAPMVNTAVVLYASGDADTDVDTYAVTDASGNATFNLPAPGHYLIAARHRANAAPGGAAQVQSFTTTLTFEALATLPEEFDVQAQQEEEADRQSRRAQRRPGRPRN